MKLALAFAFTLAVSACGGGSEPAENSATPDSGTAIDCAKAAPYSKPGPFVPAVTTVTIDGVVTEVWYPADKGAEAGKKKDIYDMRNWLPEADRSKIPDSDTPLYETNAYRDIAISKSGKYPIVLFSHGLGGYRLQSSFLMTHLASWGFVVAAPDHVERGLALVLAGDLSKIEDKATDQLKAALAWLESENGKAGSRFQGLLDLSHVAATGHSMGGAAVSTLIDDAKISSATLLASGGFGETPPGKSMMMLWGTADRVAKPSSLQTAFDKQPKGARSIGVNLAGHMAFTDLCVVGRDRGGVLQIAKDHGIKVEDLVVTLASDGCGTQPGGAAYLSPEDGWPVIDHYVTAQIRSAFGIDKAPIGLDDAAKSCFGDRVAASITK